MRVILPCPRPHCILTSPSLQDNHQIFASGSDDCTAIVWDQRSKKQLQSLYHDYQVPQRPTSPHPYCLSLSLSLSLCTPLGVGLTFHDFRLTPPLLHCTAHSPLTLIHPTTRSLLCAWRQMATRCIRGGWTASSGERQLYQIYDLSSCRPSLNPRPPPPSFLSHPSLSPSIPRSVPLFPPLPFGS